MFKLLKIFGEEFFMKDNCEEDARAHEDVEEVYVEVLSSNPDSIYYRSRYLRYSFR